ncbi:M24 family metallopeptidase [Muricomes sp. OA1]|uniref:M24 family metallopeptidase n=1 Tax=Hungatella hathewayi TaxID=154046 RepID=A0A3E2X131_9FIRM|nr:MULTISPECIES: M24 family metallopeptidase [Clostridia]MEE0201599.1 M24 family metallopeptidase [Muricomes sp.]MCH1971209.1 M24 family metallopeptidase [Muricomes sp. OA1]MRM88614.1 M24 family metallopeptidase [Faecalicatena contorta]RGC34987.1 M24 family metallopeptidase [Hungatella hathewayi]GKH34507.1 hypothetical protein CE91St64_39140 [Faecalicatena contorta]
MLIQRQQIKYDYIQKPEAEAASFPVDLTDKTMEDHRHKILEKMKCDNLDFLFVYADREHGGNFGYLTGFEPRFEEAVLVIHQNGKACLLLGNESLKMGGCARIKADVIHVPHFSLPNQPMETKYTLQELIRQAGIKEGMRGGVVGWKMFTSRYENNEKIFDAPYFLVNVVKDMTGQTGEICNKSDLFIHPGYGVRTRVNANEAAHYEFGASNAAACIMRLMEEIQVGKSELELAGYLNPGGQPLAVQTICATGERFTNAVTAPRNKRTALGDKFSMTIGLRGGLSCRTGFIAHDETELPKPQKEYLEHVVKPYYAALATWYSTIRTGITGGDIYEAVERTIPKAIFGWSLNPGHFVSGEEWLSSPFYQDSDIRLESGMMFQMDIIVSVPGYAGANAEDGILLADEELRKQIAVQYPDMWGRMQKRRKYMTETLGIPLSEDVLPMSGLCGYIRPYLLNKQMALHVSCR